MRGRKNVVLMTAYVQRYNPIVLKIKELLDNKSWGMFSSFNMDGTDNVCTGRKLDTEKDLNGGGQLFNHGCHYIDLLLYFLGNPMRISPSSNL